jgi:MFS transporter, DHA2 family, methylenomycin A resistance protein
MLLSGIAVFTLASAACAAALGAGWLIAARAVQGIGAAALLPATLALIPHLFPRPADRERATVTWVAAGSVAVAAGPLIGGLLIDTLGWRAIFLINLPVGVVAWWVAHASVPDTPRHRVPLDHAGQATATATLGLLAAGLIESGAAGWRAPATLVPLAGATIAAALFWRAERRGAHPMLPPAFLASRVRAAAVLAAGLMGFTFYGTLFTMSLYFQQLRGGSAGAAGVALLPLTASSTIGPLLLYRPLARRYGHPVLLVAGFAGAGLGTAVLATTGPATPYLADLAGLVLTGGASTIAFSALTSLLIEGTPAGQSGLGSGLQNTSRQAGALIAVSILGSVLSAEAGTGRLLVPFAVIAVAVAGGIVAGLVALGAARPAAAPDSAAPVAAAEAAPGPAPPPDRGRAG